MPSERENLSQSLTSVDYDIAGNHIRAYYDARRKLVFVIDYAINEYKPNVLLVINSYGNRKWDDVLANDYAVDLETVRPKKDNKYQKLDIEYGALGIYDDLITGFDAGNDIGASLHALDEFRIAASRRAANERLAAADVMAENARETIEKTDDTIAQLQAKIKTLRAKLSAQRKEVGKEPTKQSAAKILRTEAQIDATNEKLTRAKKRLDNAKRRLATSEEDADAAREILNMTVTSAALESPDKFPPAPDTELVAVRDALPAQVEPKITDVVPFNADMENNNNETNETKAESMADEEVKPLFDKDPEILDEEIAFKPIDFNIPVAPAEPARSPRVDTDNYSDSGVVSPLSFVPPTTAQPVADTEPAPIDVAPTPAAPVLDTITSVEMPGETETIITQEPMNVEPAPVAPAPTQMPEISPAPVSSEFRPVSPITGGGAQSVAASTRQKPTVIYYVMLVLLIALSIFTLWIYQKSVNNNVPDLTTTAPAGKEVATVAPAPAQEQNTPSPFIDAPQPAVEKVEVKETETIQVEPVSVQVEPAAEVIAEPETVPEVIPIPVEVMPVAEPEPVPVSVEPEPVSVEPEPVAMPEPVSVEPDSTVAQPVAESPFLSEPVAEPEPIINKPAYNVSQQENMFVAGPDYETDTEYTQTETDDTNAPTCADGGAPDMYGCCAGEIFTDMGDGVAACCNDDECFPPMF